MQRDLGPDGPRRIMGVDFELIPQCEQLGKHAKDRTGEIFNIETRLTIIISSNKIGRKYTSK